MRILLLGATGFVGSYVLKALLKQGHMVCIVKRSRSDTRRIRECLPDCIVYNIDEIRMEDIFRENKIICIVHCATHYGKNDTEYLQNIESNFMLPFQALYEGLKNGVKYFLNTDSFFTGQLQKDPGHWQNVYMKGYTLSKYQFWQWGHLMASEAGAYFINMKLEHVYGEGDSEGKFVPYIVKSCKENVREIALTEGKQMRDFVYVSDVADAYCKVVDSLTSNKKEAFGNYVEYEIGTGRARSLREFTELIHSALGSRSRLEWGQIPLKEGEVMASQADISKLREIGWMPHVVEDADLKRVFVKMAEEYEKNNTS